ncbi:HEAT repeat-containing protein 4 [Rhinophrynus dorsalis]
MDILQQPYQHIQFNQVSLLQHKKLNVPSDGFHGTKTFQFPVAELLPLAQNSVILQAQYIKKVVGDLQFSKEVVKDRGLACLSYQEWDANSIYNASDFKPHLQRKRMINTHPVHHNPCHMRNALPVIQVKSKSCIDFGKSVLRKSQENEKSTVSNSLIDENQKPKTFLTAPSLSKTVKKRKSGIGVSLGLSNDILGSSEKVLKMLTRTTAQWIVGHHTDNGMLRESLCHRYGLSDCSELISEEHMSEKDFRTFIEQEESKQQDDQGEEDRKKEMSLPVYYKIAANFPQPREGETPVSKNKTPESVSIKQFVLTPPKKLPDLLNPKSRKHVCFTENTFKGHLYSGASWQDATLEQLRRDLSSVHKTSKVTALVTIASAALAHLEDETKAQEMAVKANGPPAVPAVPADMLPLISKALSDEDALVRMAATLCLYFIWEVSDESKKIMFSALDNGTDADSWAAAQCLALEGEHSHPVIRRILIQLFDVGNEETVEQACFILSKLSTRTNLVHAMLGGALTNRNWRDRVVACRALSQLRGSVSRDVRNKLNYVMWEDWSPAVREAAARALGKMGHWKEIHDQIRKHLECDSWKAKVDALSLISWLQIMTAQLLHGFLQCFSDDFVAVRRQACLTAGSLQIKDEMVLNCLCQLIQNDPVWKIQACAIKALGKIGTVTPRVKELLLWSMRNEEAEVRIEACHCIASLQIFDPDVQNVLRDRLMLESHELVRREVKTMLTALNMDPTGNPEMILLIQQQISKMCQKDVLIPKVLNLSEDLRPGDQEVERLVQNTPSWKDEIHKPKYNLSIDGN